MKDALNKCVRAFRRSGLATRQSPAGNISLETNSLINYEIRFAHLQFWPRRSFNGDKITYLNFIITFRNRNLYCIERASCQGYSKH